MPIKTMEKPQEQAIERSRNLMDPWSQLERMQQMMDSMFSAGGFRPLLGRNLFAEMEPMPALNMYKKDSHLMVEVEIPGFDKKDIQVSVTGDLLSIVAEHKHEKEENKEGYFLRERRSGSLSRSLRLPMEISSDTKSKLSIRTACST